MRFFLRFFVVPFHNFVFRLTRGRALGQFDLPVLLLTTTGRRSGKQRTIPLLYLEEDSTLLVVASMAGGAEQSGLVPQPRRQPHGRGTDARRQALDASRAVGRGGPASAVRADQGRSEPIRDVRITH